MSNFDDNDCLEKLDMSGCSKQSFLKSFPGSLPSASMAQIFDNINKKVQQAKIDATNNEKNPLQDFARAAADNDILFYP